MQLRLARRLQHFRSDDNPNEPEVTMAIVKYPFRAPSYPAWRDFDEPFNRLARLFDEPSVTRVGDGIWSPAVSVSETKDELILTAELPGMVEKDIHVELENNTLSISGEKTEERKEGDEERHYHVWERSYGSFRRSFTLPRRVSGDEVNATFDKGVLTVTLPKVPEAKGRKIEISTK
jgi:HSP20 family protein